MSLRAALLVIAGVSACAAFGSVASAEIVLSQLVVELTSGAKAKDIEIFNDADERAYVIVEPRRITNPGQASEAAESPADPERLGLLVSPRKMILEPHQRRLIRIADIGTETSAERVYRITVKPEVGNIKSDANGLKLLVGYDMLVIARPSVPGHVELVGNRSGSELVITNRSNFSVELDAGEQCRLDRSDCRNLGGKRIYAGASWRIPVPYTTPVRFKVKGPDGWSSNSF